MQPSRPRVSVTSDDDPRFLPAALLSLTLLRSPSATAEFQSPMLTTLSSVCASHRRSGEISFEQRGERDARDRNFQRNKRCCGERHGFGENRGGKGVQKSVRRAWSCSNDHNRSRVVDEIRWNETLIVCVRNCRRSWEIIL